MEGCLGALRLADERISCSPGGRTRDGVGRPRECRRHHTRNAARATPTNVAATAVRAIKAFMFDAGGGDGDGGRLGGAAGLGGGSSGGRGGKGGSCGGTGGGGYGGSFTCSNAAVMYGTN